MWGAINVNVVVEVPLTVRVTVRLAKTAEKYAPTESAYNTTVPLNPLTLVRVTVDAAEAPCIMLNEEGVVVSRKLPVDFCPKVPVRNGRIDALTVTVPMTAVRMTAIVRRGRSFLEKPNRPFLQQPLR